MTTPHIQCLIFNWTYLRCYCRYFDNSMSVILQIRCQIQRTSSSLRCVNCGPGHIQWNYCSAYKGINIQLNVTALLFEVSEQFNARYTANLLSNTAHILQFTLCELWSRDVQCNDSSAYSGFNIQLNVSALLLEISRHYNERYTAILVPNTARFLRFTLCQLWSRTYTMHLQLRIFKLQYLSERTCAAIEGISSIQWALYCILGAKYSAHPPVSSMRPMVPAIYKVFSAPHI
jgi:hypothetical protein